VAIHKLVLHPVHVDCPAVGAEALVSALQRIGLVAAPACLDPASGYRAGEQFLQLVSFLGCSPAIELEPPLDPVECARACASGSLCHIRFPAAEGRIRFRADNRLPDPRCPHCRKAEDRWPELIEQWRADPREHRWACRECGYAGRLFDLNFRHRGAFGHSFIDIWGIHPAEAVPGETLLTTLGELSGCEWRYIYLQD
jgi:Zn ribbon nucleic-acid-binding protein